MEDKNFIDFTKFEYKDNENIINTPKRIPKEVVFKGKIDDEILKKVKRIKILKMAIYVGCIILLMAVAGILLNTLKVFEKIKWLIWSFIPVGIFCVIVILFSVFSKLKQPEKIDIIDGFIYFNDNENPQMEISSFKNITDKGNFYYTDNYIIFQKNLIVKGDLKTFEEFFNIKINKK